MSSLEVAISMKCPFCEKENDKVLESRITENGQSIRRRRECLSCKRRFTSYERIEEKPLWVIKRNGHKESYNREKLLSGVLRACHKRPINMDRIEKMVSEVEEELQHEKGRIVSSSKIGEITLAKLGSLDQAAYIRFASVYRQFKNVAEFVKFIRREKL